MLETVDTPRCASCVHVNLGSVVKAFDNEILDSCRQNPDDLHCVKVPVLVDCLGHAWKRFWARSALIIVSAKDSACRGMLDFRNAGSCVAVVSVFLLGFGMASEVLMRTFLSRHRGLIYGVGIETNLTVDVETKETLYLCPIPSCTPSLEGIAKL